MDLYQGISADCVRRSTPVYLHDQIARQTERSSQSYGNGSSTAIQNRMQILDEEWDVVEANALTLALTGLALGVTVNKRWLAVPAAILLFLFQHGVQS
jgi:hypothetical protein